MIYITGFSFQFNLRSKPSSSNSSIREQILSRRNNTKSGLNDLFSTAGFIAGDIYRIARICPIMENNNKKVQYLFTNISNNTQPDIVIVFNNTSAGDEYIAAIAGKQKELENERNQIKNIIAQESNF
jgi:hypothetical protein